MRNPGKTIILGPTQIEENVNENLAEEKNSDMWIRVFYLLALLEKGQRELELWILIYESTLPTF